MVAWIARIALGAEPDAAWSALEPGDAPAGVGAFTVAPLVVRVDDKLVGVTGEELRVYLIEQIRALGGGWPVVGVENPLFGQDRSADARYVLGGEIREIYPAKRERVEGTAIDVRWQVLDQRSEQVVYEVVTRGWVAGTATDHADDLVIVAAKNVLARPAFGTAITPVKAPSADPGVPLTVAKCPAGPVDLPAAFDRVLPAVVVLRSGGGSGSGVVVSPDGFILTAEHVVNGTSTVQVGLSSGPELTATVVRTDAERDLAVVHLGGTGFPCVAPAAAPPRVGQPVFVVGSPLGKFPSTVSSGVLSGIDTGEGALLQTDAAISPGNSGGPMLDAHGGLLGIVTQKISGGAVEGMGFAVPLAATTQLGVAFGERSDAVVPAAAAPAPDTVRDDADPPIVVKDGRICLYWAHGTPPAQRFQVAGTAVELLPRQYACVPVVAGMVRVERPGTDVSFAVGPELTAYVQVVGRVGLGRTDQVRFDRAAHKLTEVAVESGASP